MHPVLVKICAAFIFSREKRHAFRERHKKNVPAKNQDPIDLRLQKIEAQLALLMRMTIQKTLFPELQESWRAKFPVDSGMLAQLNGHTYCSSGVSAKVKQAFLDEQMALGHALVHVLDINDVVPFFKNLISLCPVGSPVFQKATGVLAWLFWRTSRFEEVIQLFENFYGKGQTLPPANILRYAMSAYWRTNSLERAKELTNEYVKRFKDRDLWRHYDFAFLANEVGVSNLDTKLVLDVVGRMVKAQENNDIEKLLAGKRVAIVGNGPQEVGSGNGEKIDRYDIVIRFNDFPTDEKFAQDYGRKTNVWGRSQWVRASPKIIKVIILGEALHSEYPDLNTIREIKQINPEHLFAIPPSIYSEVYLEGKVNHPTNGALMIAWMKKICPNLSANDIFGFSFKEKVPPKQLTHYYDSPDLLKGTAHNLDKERAYLRKLLAMDD